MKTLPSELSEHRERLRGAVFHACRDERACSHLVGLELPDWLYASEPDRGKMTEYIDGQLAGMRRVLLEAWEGWKR